MARGTWQTTSGSGGGSGTAVAVIAGAILVAALAGPVAAAVVSLVKALLVALAVVAVMAGALLVLAWRLRRTQPVFHHRPQLLTARRQAVLPAQQPERPAIENHQHFHFHGVSADDVAAALARNREQS